MLIKKYDQGGYATVGRAMQQTISKPPVKKQVYGSRKPLTWFLNEGNGMRTTLGQVYIPNKGTVALTADGRAFTDDNGSWKPIHLTNYDKFHISKAIKSGGSGVFGGYLGNWGKATQSVLDAWVNNSKTWLASSRPSARVAVPKPTTNSPASAREQAKNQKAVVDKTGTQPRINNTAEGKRIMDWQRKLGVKADGWWGKNTTAAYKAYVAKQNANKSSQPQTTQVTKPIQGTPGYEMHVGTNGVTLSTPNGQTTDVTKYKDGQLSAAINNGNFKAPNIGTLSTTPIYDASVDAISGAMPTTHNFTRGQIKQGMSEQGLDPSNYNRSTIKAVRNFTNNPTMDNYNDNVAKVIGDARVQQRMTNQYASEMAQNHSLQAPKLNIPDNLLVSYKKQGGMLVNKYQQGGATSDPMDQLAQVAAKFLQGDAQSGQQLAQVFSDQKVGKQLMQAVQQGVQQKDKRAIIIAQAIQALSGSRKARLGAKLNYFHKDICPAGEKLVYFKKGGEICKACQKMDMGGEMADDKKKSKPSLNKKPQNKPIQNKQKINQKPNNKRPGPKDLKSLPNGKYPVYWTADQRGQWDRDHDEGV